MDSYYPREELQEAHPLSPSSVPSIGAGAAWTEQCTGNARQWSQSERQKNCSKKGATLANPF
jgi:hypothetical protein